MSASRKSYLLIAAAILLTSCVSTQDDGPRARTYVLPAVSIKNKSASDEVVVVARPAAAPDLDSSRIILHRNSQSDYYAGMRWADTLPDVVQSALVESIQNIAKDSGTESSSLTPTMLMQLDIQDLQAEYGSDDAPVINIKITGRLWREPGHETMKQLRAVAKVKATQNSRNAIMKAFNEAFIKAESMLLQQAFNK